MKSLQDKGVLITGGTTGIGRAIGIQLAREGARIYTFGRDEQHLQDGMEAIGKAGEIHGRTADQASHDDMLSVFADAKKKLKQLDIVIANAAISAEGIAALKDEDWRYAVDTNLSGYLDVSKQAIAAFGDKGGDLILIGSISSDAGQKDTSVYAATKAGLQGFAASLRKEVADKNIRVTLIEPGSVGSDMQDSPPEEQRRKIDKAQMLKAEDVAELVSFIVSRPDRCTLPIVRIEPRIQKDA